MIFHTESFYDFGAEKGFVQKGIHIGHSLLGPYSHPSNFTPEIKYGKSGNWQDKFRVTSGIKTEGGRKMKVHDYKVEFEVVKK